MSAEEIERLKEQLEMYRVLYHSLLYLVHKKHPNESRHETAARYIREAEVIKLEREGAKNAEE